MDKKQKKRVDILHQQLAHFRQQLAGAKKQMDDPAEVKHLEQRIAAVEAELAALKAAGGS